MKYPCTVKFNLLIFGTKIGEFFVLSFQECVKNEEPYEKKEGTSHGNPRGSSDGTVEVGVFLKTTKFAIARLKFVSFIAFITHL